MRLKNCSSLLLTGALLLSSALSFSASADTAEALVAACTACHGAKGVSPGGAWPSLAGQKRGYLEQQLRAFRDGERKDASMTPFVASLTDPQIKQIAEHYASMQLPGNAASKTINKSGENVRANCMSCHGINGFTVNDSWPSLAGQNSTYLLRQLELFKDGSRRSPIMNVIANELNEQQMRDVAEYYSQLAY